MACTDCSKTILELEQSLFNKRFISDLAYLDAVIADSFEECGKSGRIFDKAEIITFLLSCEDSRNIVIEDFRCREIGDNVFLANYETVQDGGRIYRTSIWTSVATHYGYNLVFHQATLLERDDKAAIYLTTQCLSPSNASPC